MNFRNFIETIEGDERNWWQQCANDPQSCLVYADWLEENNLPNAQYAQLLRGNDKFRIVAFDNSLRKKTKSVNWNDLLKAIQRYQKKYKNHLLASCYTGMADAIQDSYPNIQLQPDNTMISIEFQTLVGYFFVLQGSSNNFPKWIAWILFKQLGWIVS
jgi:hypothetical protein